MVRLKALCSLAHTEQLGTFQFQNGAIKSGVLSYAYARETLFQFQNGAIKSKVRLNTCLKDFSFNSKMVRLKDNDGQIFRRNRFLFQFQNGAIKRKKRTPLRHG